MSRALPTDFVDPSRDYSLAPFWFWNDDLDADEIRRQIDDFHDHGVYAFVIHPRVGLPRSLPFMSVELLCFMRIAVEHAKRRGMWVILYDEGMYPSGAASGLVVAENPMFACRGLVRKEVGENDDIELEPGHHLIVTTEMDGKRFAIIDRPIESHIRGLHYADHNAPRDPAGSTRFDVGKSYGPPVTAEDLPPAADLLNPDAVAAFIRIVYDGYADALGEYFGDTVRAIFTDEPMVMGRGVKFGARPGTTGIVDHVNRWFGRDVSAKLPLLWEKSEAASVFRSDYIRAIKARLETTYYQPLQDWCQRHGLALTGHPHEPDDLGLMRYFDWPGQDIVWHMIRPGASALVGHQSTQAKAAASAKAHQGRKRNANEYLGAYGHDVSLDLMEWVTNWLVVRGCDLLIPHAFFYSVRGARIDECPPQLGPFGRHWNHFKRYADTARRLCWLNAEAQPVVDVAVLALPDHCPERAAATLFQNQIDFHYLQTDDLPDAQIDEQGLTFGAYRYRAVIVDGFDPSQEVTQSLEPLGPQSRLIDGAVDEAEMITRLRDLGCGEVRCTEPSPGLRIRHLRLPGEPAEEWVMVFNEGETQVTTAIQVATAGDYEWIDPSTLTIRRAAATDPVSFPPHQFLLLRINPD